MHANIRFHQSKPWVLSIEVKSWPYWHSMKMNSWIHENHFFTFYSKINICWKWYTILINKENRKQDIVFLEKVCWLWKWMMLRRWNFFFVFKVHKRKFSNLPINTIILGGWLLVILPFRLNMYPVCIHEITRPNWIAIATTILPAKIETLRKCETIYYFNSLLLQLVIDLCIIPMFIEFPFTLQSNNMLLFH